MNEFKKKELIEKIAHSLDITPDMYNKAQSVVSGLSAFLLNQGDAAIEVYKQGSFKLGTIVKPYQKDKYGDFDIDIVVQFADSKNDTKPEIIKNRLGAYLKNQNYSNYLDDEGRRCWTLKYPPHTNGNTITFHIDLLPCVSESENEKVTIKPDEFKNTSVAITNIKDKRTNPFTYEWLPSNPKGYAEWFDRVNYGKYREIKANDRRRVFESYSQSFASMESISDDYTRSPLQRIIQILKRHRDVMFANKERAAYKPISIIITTLVGKIIEENDITENNTYNLLNNVLKGLEYYSSLQTAVMTSDFAEEYKTKQLISKRMIDGIAKWSIKNPANSSENLANKWNTDSRYATEFFKWVKQAQTDLVDILDNKPEEIIAKFKYCLGEEIATTLKGFNFSDTVVSRPVPENTVKPKPFRT